MKEIVMLCKDGTVNSYLSTLVVAMNMKKKGDDVAVVFMQEGLASLIKKEFTFSEGLKVHSDDIKSNAEMMGVPADPLDLIKKVKASGVFLYACQAWMKLLGGKPPKYKIPDGLEKLELTDLIELLQKAKKVITL